MVPIIPAIALAIHDATGIWVRQLPATPSASTGWCILKDSSGDGTGRPHGVASVHRGIRNFFRGTGV